MKPAVCPAFWTFWGKMRSTWNIHMRLLPGEEAWPIWCSGGKQRKGGRRSGGQSCASDLSGRSLRTVTTEKAAYKKPYVPFVGAYGFFAFFRQDVQQNEKETDSGRGWKRENTSRKKKFPCRKKGRAADCSGAEFSLILPWHIRLLNGIR